ncbi:MAG: DUF6683 family protein [bacterium]
MKKRYLTPQLLLGWASLMAVLAWAPGAIAQYAGSLGNMYNTISFASKSLSISQNSYYDTLHRGQKLGSGPAHSSSTPSYNPSYPPPNTGTMAPPPLPPQYPITATDFTPSPNRIVPDQLVEGMPNLPPDQKEAIRNMYNQTLAVVETKFRKNNLANSFAFIVATSQQIVGGRPVSGDEIASLVNYYNNTLANSPQFRSYPERQKQILSESLILTAASMDAIYTKGGMQNDPAAQKQARELAKSFLKNLAGINVE